MFASTSSGFPRGSTSPTLNRCCLQNTTQPDLAVPSSSPAGSPRALALNIIVLIEGFETDVKIFLDLPKWDDSIFIDINSDLHNIIKDVENMTANDLHHTLIAFNKLMTRFHTEKSRGHITIKNSAPTVEYGKQLSEALARRVLDVYDEMDTGMVVDFSIFFSKSRYEIGKLIDPLMYKMHEKIQVVAEGMTVEQVLKMLEVLYETSHLGGIGEAILIDKATQLARLLDISQIETLLSVVERSKELSGIRRKYTNGVNEFQLIKLVRGLIEQIRTLAENKNIEPEEIFSLLMIFHECQKTCRVPDQEQIDILGMLASRMIILSEKMSLKELVRSSSNWYPFHSAPFTTVPGTIPGIPFDVIPNLIQKIALKTLPQIQLLSPLQISQIIPTYTTFEMNNSFRLEMISAIATQTIACIHRFTFRQSSIVLTRLMHSGVKIQAVEEAANLSAKKIYELSKNESLISLAEAAVTLTFPSLIGPITKMKVELLERIQNESHKLKPDSVVKLAKIYATATIHDDHYRAMITVLARLTLLKCRHVDKDTEKAFVMSLIDSFSKFSSRTVFCVSMMEYFADLIIFKNWPLNREEKAALQSAYQNYNHDSSYFTFFMDFLSNPEQPGLVIPAGDGKHSTTYL